MFISDFPKTNWEKRVAYAIDHYGKSFRVRSDRLPKKEKDFSKTFVKNEQHEQSTLDSLKADFGCFINRNLSDLVRELNLEENPEFEKFRKEKTGKDFLDECFPRQISAGPIGVTSELVVEAHMKWQLMRNEIRDHFASPREVQVGKICSNLATPKPFFIIRKAPPIRNLVLKGGGAKGVGYIGALNAMGKFKFLDNIQKISGTSAGALTASLVAFGLHADEIDKILNENKMVSLIGKDNRIPDKQLLEIKKINITDFPELLTRMPIGGRHQATTLIRIFNDCFHQATNRFFEEIRLETLAIDQQALADADRNRLIEMKDPSHIFRFSDLDLLHRISPKTFRELTLVAYDIRNHEPLFFNHQTTPDLPVCMALRMSMSIPWYFAPVEYTDSEGIERTVVDGGVTSNVPSECFLDGQHTNPKERDWKFAETLVLTFDEKNKAFFRLHRFNPDRATPRSTWTGKFSGNPNYDRDDLQDNIKEYRSGPNTLVVFHGDLGTFSFSSTPNQVLRAKMQAELGMLEQINLRKNQGIIQYYASLEEMVEDMDAETLKALVTYGPPNPKKYDGGKENQYYKEEYGIYTTVKNWILTGKEFIRKKFWDDFIFCESDYQELVDKTTEK